MTEANFDPELLPFLVSFLPPRVARTILSNPGYTTHAEAEQFPAALLMADISGFTSLTERLAEHRPEGAEELTALLNLYFRRMIDLLSAEGGEVVQFSGDALLATFARPDESLAEHVQRACQAAAQMQAAMTEFGTLSTSIGPVALGMKIMIGAGEIVALSIGGVRGRWQYIIAGPPLAAIAQAAEMASSGMIKLTPEAEQLRTDHPHPARPLESLALPDPTPELIEALRTHVPGAISYRLFEGQFGWLAELRRMSIVFLGIGGLEYDSPEHLGFLQEAMTKLQLKIYKYEGSLNKFLVDDKGTISIIIFGAPPFAHHDDPLRAVRCALELQELAEQTGLRLAVGITTGQVFTGLVGSELRREYTVMGDPVNLAARLMKRAGRGGIFCDHTTYQATRNDIDWETLTPISVRGRVAAVRCYRPLGTRRSRDRVINEQPLIGRMAEQSQMRANLSAAITGQTRVLMLEGEAGIGKTRLFYDLVRYAAEHDLVTLYGSGHSIDHETPYRAWSEIFSAYFDLDRLADAPLEQQCARVIERLHEIAPELLERAALLNDLLNLGLPESDLVRSLDPRLRQASLTALLIDLLTLWASEQPLVLALEDAQWLDPLSWKLAERIARTLDNVPLLLVIIHQPLGTLPHDHALVRLRQFASAERMVLAPMAAEEVVEVAALRLGASSLPPAVAKLISQTASGNPFVAEELAVNLLETAAIRMSDGECLQQHDLSRLEIPDNVERLVLSRLDRLGPTEQLTLKVAAVIGRVFDAMILESIYPARLDQHGLHPTLDRLVSVEMLSTLQSYSQFRTHAFKQAITHEVAYSTLLHAQRRTLHEQVAHFYEQRPVEEQPELYALLVHHWHHAGHHERELHYAVLAAQKFAAEYANQAALSHLNRALELTRDSVQRGELLWQTLHLHERTGQRERQREDLACLEVLAEQQGDQTAQARVANAWADYYLQISDYPAARAVLDQARSLTLATDQVNQARTQTLLGKIDEYEGDYRTARHFFGQALASYRSLEDQRGVAANLQNLGNAWWYLGDYAIAHNYDLEALAIMRTLGDRGGEAVSLNNIAQSELRRGNLSTARTYCEQALAVARAIGDRGSEAFSQAVLAESYLVGGDYPAAINYFAQAIPLLRAVGERRREANCLNVLGQVYRDLGNRSEAHKCCSQALNLQLAIGERSYAAYSCLNLCSVTADDDPTVAQAYCSQALALARELHNQDAEAYALAYRAWLAERAGNWQAATADYQAALAIRGDNQAAACEDQAGLIRVALAQDDQAALAQWLSVCTAYLATNEPLGIEFPVRLYLSLGDGYAAQANHDQATHWYTTAYSLLTSRATAISDPVMRNQFLNASPEHRRAFNTPAQSGQS
ncbi:MAG: tetratricopeptide repeat protein [Oscillochloridaceae bacterium umkhey_bin13]